MLIAEEYLMLTMDDKGMSYVSHRELGVAGSLLCELAAREKVMLDERSRLAVIDATSTGDELLDEALLRVGEKVGRKPKDALRSIGKNMPRRLLERMATAELVQEDRSEVLGMRMWSAWPLVDTAPREAVRTDLLQVLTGAVEPDARTGALISLVEATAAWGPALPKEARSGLKMREIRARAREIAKGRWGSEAVAKTVAELAAIAATSAAAFVATSS